MAKYKKGKAPAVSIDNGYDKGMKQTLTATLASLLGGFAGKVTMVNTTGGNVTYTVNSTTELLLANNATLSLNVANTTDIKVKGAGDLTYIINTFNLEQ